MLGGLYGMTHRGAPTQPVHVLVVSTQTRLEPSWIVLTSFFTSLQSSAPGKSVPGSYTSPRRDGLLAPLPPAKKPPGWFFTNTRLNTGVGAHCGLPLVRFVLLTFSNMSNCRILDVHLLLSLIQTSTCGCFLWSARVTLTLCAISSASLFGGQCGLGGQKDINLAQVVLSLLKNRCSKL